ncbi:hypothetical protein [Pseudonocardia sp. NPDC046786]|uniref:hypothetical protein n=1 Tax=Pseudonocardia sp. NPDC046786 TaxID=3155471 RepID=UPI0033CB79F4
MIAEEVGIGVLPTDRLVLAFDATCGTCKRMAEAVRVHAYGVIDVVPLSHPEVVRQREDLLGPEPPWVPTLIDIADRKAWTGLRLRTTLTRRLGVRKSVRMLAAIGAASAATQPAKPGELSRGEFFKAASLVVAGAAVVGIGGKVSGRLAEAAGTGPASSAIRSSTPMGTAQISSQFATSLTAQDLRNVADPDLVDLLSSSRQASDHTLSKDYGVWTLSEAGTTRLDAHTTVRGERAVVRATEHLSYSGARAVTTAIVVPSRSLVLTYEVSDGMGADVRTHAHAWNFDAKTGDMTLRAYSVNGSHVEALRNEPDAPLRASAQQADPCGGCDLVPGGTDRTLGSRCKGGVPYECAKSSAACGACVVGCRGVPTAACLSCLGSTCPFAWIECCGGREPACLKCGQT